MTKDLKWKTLLITGVILLFLIYLLPTFLGKKNPDTGEDGLLPAWWPGEKLTLGLDLQGGMHIVYNIHSEVAIEHEVNRIKENVKERFQEANIGIEKIEPHGEAGVKIVLSNGSDLSRAREIVREYYSGNDFLVRTVGSALAIDLSKAAKQYYEHQAVEQVRTNIMKRIDGLGVREPTVVTKGTHQLVVELPGVVDPEQAEKVLKEAGVLHLKLVKDYAPTREALLEKLNGKIPEGYDIYLQRDKFDRDRITGAFLLKKIPDVDGTLLSDARVGYDENGQYAVNFSLNPRGAKIFGELTSKNIGRRLAILLNDEVQSAPNIRSRIDARGQITGNFTLEEAKGLAIVLRAGALPVPIETEEQRTVGATLGHDSIERGKVAIAIGAILVVLFMLFYYRVGGIIANIALFLNLIVILGAMVMLGATLTLPGIAGIVLTIGMAVDANVIIFERIREELRIGKTLRSAVDAGYGKALSAIMDANITTLIAALVLGQYGTGPIKGFAVTLGVGIVASLFTAVVVTRLIFDILLTARKLQNLSMLSIIPADIDINFTGKKQIIVTALVSSLAIVLSIALIPQIKYGIDFAGGAEILVQFKEKVTAQEIRDSLEKLPLGESLVQTFGETQEREYAIKVGHVEGKNVEEIANTISEGFAKDFGRGNFEILKKDLVGPKAGAELRQQGILSVFFASLLILVYLAFRFDYKYSPGAIVAALHDALLPVGVMVLLGREFTLQTIAALLAIVGYSINDTIIVFDRIRENRGRLRSKPLADIVRISVNETLSRTLLTSITTLLTIVSMMLFGGAVIHDFALVLFVGVIVGTYSSVFVASPVLLLMEKRFGTKTARKS